MVKLKEENVTLKSRVAALETDLAKAKRKLTRYFDGRSIVAQKYLNVVFSGPPSTRRTQPG